MKLMKLKQLYKWILNSIATYCMLYIQQQQQIICEYMCHFSRICNQKGNCKMNVHVCMLSCHSYGLFGGLWIKSKFSIKNGAVNCR